MKFIIKKEDLFNGLRITSGIATLKSLQPVLANVLIETIEKNKIKLTTTDFDLTIQTQVDAQVEKEGKITLPAKKLNDIVAKMNDNLIIFELNEETNTMNISSNNTKFDIIGISANEFPQTIEENEFKEKEAIDINLKMFSKVIKQVGFAAANYETSNILSGIMCCISDNILEMASTDGNRLARIKEQLETKDNNIQIIIPSKTLNEFNKISSNIEDEVISIMAQKTKIIIKTKTTLIISRILEGQYPKYNQLIPKETPKTALVDRLKLIEALERVSVMVNEKTNIIKLNFTEDKLQLLAEAPDSGKGEDEISIKYKEEDLLIAFNYKYVLDCLRNMENDEIKIGLNTNSSATIFKPNNEEDYISLIMPVQIR